MTAQSSCWRGTNCRSCSGTHLFSSLERGGTERFEHVVARGIDVCAQNLVRSDYSLVNEATGQSLSHLAGSEEPDFLCHGHAGRGVWKCRDGVLGVRWAVDEVVLSREIEEAELAKVVCRSQWNAH